MQYNCTKLLFNFQLHHSSNDKGPDAQAEALRQMLTQHMVCFYLYYYSQY